ncbi:MAG: hypothetical protein QOE95_1684 [Gaiellaceae bacterium]|nr:hypothetical protein [Gaiellaceae bacterium]
MGKTRELIERLEERRERHAERTRLYRVAFGVAAALVLLVGIFLSLPLVPGPGLPLIAVGLAMLALEFAWAERLLRRIAHRIDQVEERIGWLGIVALLVAAVVVGAAAVYWKM